MRTKSSRRVLGRVGLVLASVIAGVTLAAGPSAGTALADFGGFGGGSSGGGGAGGSW